MLGMEKLRIGIIGVGGIARGRHIPAFKQLSSKAIITAVTDVNLDRAKEAAEEFNIPNVYPTYEEMFEHVDAVVICTPNKFHAEISIAALEAGVHALTEKPMALNVSECEAMLAAAKKSGKVLGVAYHFRFMKNVLAAKQVMLADEIGNPLVVRCKRFDAVKFPDGVFSRVKSFRVEVV